MNCIHINIRKATFILLTFLANTVHYTQMADNSMDSDTSVKQPNRFKNGNLQDEKIGVLESGSKKCPAERCVNLDLNNHKCRYGDEITVNCTHNPYPDCKVSSEKLICRYCYQTYPWEHTCELKGQCNSVASPRPTYLTNCTVNDGILCFGSRTFNKNVKCNWTVGYRWTTALALSITLGGFGADRFYLGHWQEGIGKLFSFGGLGVWTLIDVILISLHYLGPADGSLYI